MRRFSFMLIITVLIGLVVLVRSTPAQATRSASYLNPIGSARPVVACAARLNDDPTDYASVQAAVTASNDPLDVVKVAGTCSGVEVTGGFTQTVYITKSLMIQGGYATTDWTTPHPITQPTTLDALGSGRVIVIVGDQDIDVTLENLTLTGGAVPDSIGGGVYAVSATLTISNSSLVSNTARSGGGLFDEFADTTLTDSAILSNTATAAGAGLLHADGLLEINHSTIGYNQNQRAAPALYGGAGMDIEACDDDALVTINDSLIIGNQDQLGAGGGGINNLSSPGHLADLTINNSTLTDNATTSYAGTTGFGGGLNNSRVNCPGIAGQPVVARTTLNDSVVKNNHATNGGGIGNGLLNITGATLLEVNLNNSTVSGNTAGVLAGGYITQTGNGGGVFNLNGQLNVINSTFSGNAATTTSFNPATLSGLGGNVANAAAGLPTTAIFTQTTIAQGQAFIGAGVANAYLVPVSGYGAATVMLQGSLIAGNTALAGAAYNGCLNNSGAGTALVVSNGYNLETNNTCGLTATGDLTNTDPLLGPLANNGGPVTGSGLPPFTHALLKGSPALDVMPVLACQVDTDERGEPRPAGAGCDIGAYEAQYSVYLPLILR